VTPRPKIVVIGGGLAGIAACEKLSREENRPFDLLLLEGRPHLGGRTGSFVEKSAGKEIDTGQHLFLSCYTRTLELLEQLGTRPGLVLFDHLYLSLWDRERGLHPLDIPGSDNPLALASGLLQYGGLPFSSRLAFLRLSRSIPENSADVDHLTAREFLKRAGQPDAVIDRFWELVILSATNLSSRVVSAAILVRILKESLLKGGSHSRPGYNAIPLAELFVRPAMKLFSSRGVEVRLQTRVTGLRETSGKLSGIETSRESLTLGEKDHVISALPPWSFEKIAPAAWHGTALLEQMSRLAYASPILSVHLHFDTPVFLPLITGFHESKIHWLFNKDAMEEGVVPESSRSWFDWSESRTPDLYSTHLVSATVSGADELMALTDEALGDLCLEHVRMVDKRNTARPKKVQAVRDRFATPIFGVGQSTLRPDARTPFENFWMAGDSTDTGLPATMEGAVRSGYRAAELVREAMANHRIPPPAPGKVPE